MVSRKQIVLDKTVLIFEDLSGLKHIKMIYMFNQISGKSRAELSFLIRLGRLHPAE